MHDKALTTEASRLFGKLGLFKSFYLVGGTALALQIGHRVSVDFDLFSEKKLPTDLLQKIKRVFSGSDIEVTYRSADQINVLVNGVKMTFFYYPYPVLDPLMMYQNVSMASLHEIAAMKALAIGKRLSFKDYVDWYFLLSRKHVTLAGTIKLAEAKFGGDFNDRLFLGQLVSLSDIPDQKIDFLDEAVGRQDIETTIKAHVKEMI